MLHRTRAARPCLQVGEQRYEQWKVANPREWEDVMSEWDKVGCTAAALACRAVLLLPRADKFVQLSHVVTPRTLWIQA